MTAAEKNARKRRDANQRRHVAAIDLVSALEVGIDAYLTRNLSDDGSAIVARFKAPNSGFLGPRFRPKRMPNGEYGVTLYQARRILQALGRPSRFEHE